MDIKEAQYDGFHDCIEFRVRGSLPRDKEKMLLSLDKAIAENTAKEETKVAYTAEKCWIDGFHPLEENPL